MVGMNRAAQPESTVCIQCGPSFSKSDPPIESVIAAKTICIERCAPACSPAMGQPTARLLHKQAQAWRCQASRL